MKILLVLASLLMLQDAGRPGFGSVSGQIRATDGSPASGVRVAAMAVDENGTVNPAVATLASLGQTDSQGRYLLENVPPGRYFITAGFLDTPSYYPGVKTTAEARSITVAPREGVANMDFVLARPAGVRVRGIVRNLPSSTPPGLLRAILMPIGRPGTSSVDVAVNADGTFEFAKAAPGPHNVRLTPGAAPLVRVDVDDKDIDGVELTATPMVFGHVTIEDGNALPVQAAALAAGIPDPPALFRLQASRQGNTGIAGTTVRRDGLFVLPLTAGIGSYAITATLIPMGHFVKSISYGTADLLQSLLTLTAEAGSTEIKVVLTTTPPAGTPAGAKLSGRVTALENGPAGASIFVSLQSHIAATVGNPATVTRVSETRVKEDGTFEITGIPPGRYSLRTIPAPSQILNVDVAEVDIRGLELTLRNLANPLSLSGTLVVTSSGPPPPPPPPPLLVPPLPRPDAAILSVSQSGRGPGYVEGAVSFFRVERSGTPVEELRLDGGSVLFTLPPGNYELHSFVRPCNGNCSRLDPPRDTCTAPFTAMVGQVLYAERVMQGSSCTIQFRRP